MYWNDHVLWLKRLIFLLPIGNQTCNQTTTRLQPDYGMSSNANVCATFAWYVVVLCEVSRPWMFSFKVEFRSGICGLLSCTNQPFYLFKVPSHFTLASNSRNADSYISLAASSA